jgi:hypothetical protein
MISKNFPKAFITGISELGYYTSESSEAYEKNVKSLVVPSRFPDLEKTISNYPPEYFGCATVEAVYGYAALIILF